MTTAAGLVLLGCQSDGASGPLPAGQATVVISYDAPTAIDSSVAAAFPDCVSGVEFTHIHPSWRGYATIALTPQGERGWTSTFADVPVGEEVTIQIGDPNSCGTETHGYSTQHVFANGVLLTHVVGTLGSDDDPPALTLQVAADGTVTP